MAILPKLEPPVLPSGYVELEYVEQPLGNSGYFKTGLTPSNTLDFEICGVTYDNVANTGYGCLFGSRTSATYEYQLNTYIDTGTSRLGTMRVGTNAYSAGLVKNQEFEAYTDDTTYSFNGTETEITRDFADASPAEIYVFAFNVADGGTDRVRQNGHGKIKYLRFKNNGDYVRIYVPCKNKAGTVGFYDTVNDTFNPSLATAFVGGPIVMRRPLTVGISQKIIDIQVIKEDLRDAINGHYNSDVLDYYDGLVDYADAIDGITGSQRVLPTEPSVVNFIDYDGTLLYAYTAAEFRALDGMPPDPFHSGLIAQGWNWTRKEILDYLNRAPRIDVGQNYITHDGATRLYMDIKGLNLLTTLTYQQTKTEGVLIDWGDGNSERFSGTGSITANHTYTNEGKYIIRMFPDEDCTIQLCTSPSNTTSGDNQSTLFYQYRYRGFRARSLYKVELGKGITRIGSNAFYKCMNLETCSVPNQIEVFSDACFQYCYKLRNIVVGRNTIELRVNCFCGSYFFKYVSISPNKPNFYMGGQNFYLCPNIEYALIPDNVTTLGGGAFYYCYGLKTVYLSRMLTALRTNLFRSCYTLQRVTMPSRVTILGSGTVGAGQQSYVFGSTLSLLSLEVPEGVEYIPAYFVYDCMSLLTCIFPSTVTTIESNAFKNATTLRRMVVKATTPPTLKGTFSNTFGAITGGTNSHGGKTATLYVPYSEDHSILNSYKAASNWSTYASYMQELNADGSIPSDSYWDNE